MYSYQFLERYSIRKPTFDDGKQLADFLDCTLNGRCHQLAGVLPAEVYWDLLERISSHGFVVVGIWTLTELPTSQIKPDWLKKVDHWLQVGVLPRDGALFLPIKCRLTFNLMAQLVKLIG